MGEGSGLRGGELGDTEYILKASATRLITDRRRGISAEMESYIQGQEAKLIKHFSRVFVLAAAQVPSASAASPADLALWLSVVNVSAAAADALSERLDGLDALLRLPEPQLAQLAATARLEREDRRRFLKATTNLRSYTQRWKELGSEPSGEFSTAALCWVSYERPSGPKSPSALVATPSELSRADEARRSVSESGMDSGASDSGLGSNVSQNSLPTTTPPPSPMWGVLGTNSLSVRSQFEWGQLQAAASAARSTRGLTPPTASGEAPSATSTPRTSTKSSSSTPPPSLKWGTGLKGADATTPGTEDPVMIRSHSHESNLQNRIHRVLPATINEPPSSARLLPSSRSTAKPASLRIQQPAEGAIRRASGEGTPSCLVISPDEGSDAAFLSPTSPGPLASAAAARSRVGSVSTNPPPLLPKSASVSAVVDVPRSPRTGGRIFHAIPHQFRRKILNPSKACSICKRGFGIRGGEKCKSCRLVVHSECKKHLSDTCGLTPEHVRSIIDLLVDPPPLETEGRNPALSPEYTLDGTDSSSCNSSQPSTPAPHSSLPSPYPYSAQPPNRKFTFPELPEQQEVPNIRIDAAGREDEWMTETRNSDNSTIIGSQTGLSSQGSVSGSVSTLNYAGDDGPQLLHREPSLLGQGWREVTIRLADIDLGPRLRQGLFGPTHKGYHHQDVAVKFLDMDHVPEQQRLEAFKSEVGLMKHTRHENVVLFMGYVLEPPSRLGLVLNFCHGHSLHVMLHEKRERPDLARILTIATQIAQGMSYLHGKKILHRDLRAKNVFVQARGKVVLSDFGVFSLRRLLAAQRRSSDGTPIPAGLTRSALRVPDHWLCYLAPQLLRALVLPPALPADDGPTPNLPFSQASDLFAFGTLWYEMLSGDFPWKATPPHTLIWQVASGLRPPLHSLTVVKEIKELMLECWSGREEGGRSFAEVLGSLDRLPRKARPLTRSPSHPVSLSRSAESMF